MDFTFLGILIGAVGALCGALVRVRVTRPASTAPITGSWPRRARADGTLDLLMLVPCGCGFALAIVLQAIGGFDAIGIGALFVSLIPPTLWVLNEELLAPLRTRGFPASVTAALVIAVVVVVVVVVVLNLGPAPVKEAKAHAGAQYPVVGTVIDGYKGLNQRRGPGREFTTTKTRLHDGDYVTPVCEAFGSPPARHHSRRWLLLDTGWWVSALFVDLPVGPQRLPTCRPAQIPDHVV